MEEGLGKEEAEGSENQWRVLAEVGAQQREVSEASFPWEATGKSVRSSRVKSAVSNEKYELSRNRGRRGSMGAIRESPTSNFRLGVSKASCSEQLLGFGERLFLSS